MFIYEKKSPEAEKIPKKHREALLAMLKKGPTQLIRLKHPRLLTIEHQLQESRWVVPRMSKVRMSNPRMSNAPCSLHQ